MDARKPSDMDMQVAALIRARRLELKMSMEELAAALNISHQQVQKYEAGKNRISIGRLSEIAQALNVHPTFFLVPQPRPRR